jgi:hypothetical protein
MVKRGERKWDPIYPLYNGLISVTKVLSQKVESPIIGRLLPIKTVTMATNFSTKFDEDLHITANIVCFELLKVIMPVMSIGAKTNLMAIF